MLSRNVLAKGQIVIPKTIRDLLGIRVGDEMVIDVEDEKMILSKKQDVVGLFERVSEGSPGGITIKDIKGQLRARYEED